MAGTDPRHNKFIIAPVPTCTPKGAPLCFAFNAWFLADHRSSSVAENRFVGAGRVFARRPSCAPKSRVARARLQKPLGRIAVTKAKKPGMIADGHGLYLPERRRTTSTAQILHYKQK
jgi:hypothetical protein